MPSEKAMRVYEYIADRVANDIAPTVREICRDCDIYSTSTVQRYLAQLCEEGLLTRQGNSSRSLQLPKREGIVRVPIVGKVAAGEPISALQDIEGYVALPGTLGLPDELFALRIAGDSMVGAGILEGDIVVINRYAQVENGMIVVAMVDDSATVKRFFKEDQRVRLQPENDAYRPILLDDVTILGKVVATMRYY